MPSQRNFFRCYCACSTGPATMFLPFIFNLLFLAAGVYVLIMGMGTQVFFKQYIQLFDEKFQMASLVTEISGGIIVALSFLGCCGAMMQNKCFLRLYSFLMVVVLLCPMIAGISVAILRPEMEELVKGNMETTMANYSKSDGVITVTWDDLQSNYKCCGSSNYTDWENTTYGTNVTGVPDSCCKELKPGCGNDVFKNITNNVYTDGCYTAFAASAMMKLGTIVTCAVALVVLLLVGILLSCCLSYAGRQGYENLY